MLQDQEILQPGSGPEEPSNLIRLQVSLDKSGRLTPVRYDVISDAIYMDVNGEHPDGFSSQETLKVTARSSDPYSVRIWELTEPQRKFHKARYKQDMRDMTGIPQMIQQDVRDAERGGEQGSEREEVITESVAANERHPGQSMFQEEGEPVTRPQTPQGALAGEHLHPGQHSIQVPMFSQEMMLLNNLVSDGRSAIEDLGQLFDLYVEDEKIKAFGANVVKRIQRKYYEYGVSDVNPDVDPSA